MIDLTSKEFIGKTIIKMEIVSSLLFIYLDDSSFITVEVDSETLSIYHNNKSDVAVAQGKLIHENKVQ